MKLFKRHFDDSGEIVTVAHEAEVYMANLF
jgi:hypothetical protein